MRRGTTRKAPGKSAGSGSVQELARRHTKTAIETLVAICDDDEQSASSRIAAAQALLDRGHGKASAVASSSTPSATANALLAALEALPDDERAKLDAAFLDTIGADGADEDGAAQSEPGGGVAG